MKKNNSVVITILVAVIVGALGFFGGMQYTKMQRGGAAGRFGGAGGQFGGAGGGRFGAGGANGGSRPVVGLIDSLDNNSLTIKMPDGSSKIVILSNSTTVNKQTTGSKDDLKQGENVMVMGTTNSDGSVTATSVSLNPMMRGGTMMRGQSATPSGQ
jgi:hypothetical protein